MSKAYIVTKKQIIRGLEYPVYFTTNEAVFIDEGLAIEYIEKRKAAKVRDDRGCEFAIEIWTIQTETSLPETSTEHTEKYLCDTKEF